MGTIDRHFGIEQVRNDYEILMGRMPDERGAHTKGRNLDSIGICFVGNYDIYTPPYGMWIQGLRLVRYLCRNYNIPADEIYGHRDFADKTCPGKLFDIQKFKEQL